MWDKKRTLAAQEARDTEMEALFKKLTVWLGSYLYETKVWNRLGQSQQNFHIADLERLPYHLDCFRWQIKFYTEAINIGDVSLLYFVYFTDGCLCLCDGQADGEADLQHHRMSPLSIFSELEYSCMIPLVTKELSESSFSDMSSRSFHLLECHTCILPA